MQAMFGLKYHIFLPDLGEMCTTIRMNVWGLPEHFQPITADSVYLLRDWLKKFVNQTN